MSKKLNLALTLSFIVYIGGFLGLQLLTEDKAFSELENRTLQTKPTFTWQRFKDGDYTNEVSEYVADQFPFRNKFIEIKSYAELIQGKKDNNGVYVGKDGYLLQMFDQPDETMMLRNANYINEFAKEFNIHLMLVPTATKIYEDKLPNFATPFDERVYIHAFEQELDDDINLVNAIDKLESHKEEYIYYKTDHHWTTLGAYYGYVAFCESYGIEPVALEAFEQIEASDAFYGSLFSKGNFTFVDADSLYLFRSEQDANVQVEYVADETVTDTVYELSHLDKKDKYSVFLDNNHPIIKITTDVNNGKKLMVLKDSYANSMMPFLVNHFEEIHILDLRFLNMPVGEYARENDIEDVLMLYNTHNFANETKFSLLR